MARDPFDRHTDELPIPGIRIGYARVSTSEQDAALQHDAFAKAGIDRVYTETVSGKNADRPELAQCLKALRAGDTLVVWRLDRLGRSLADLVRIVTDLQSRKVGFESLTERIETVTASGQLMFHVFGAMAQFEREILRERTAAGLFAARARGRKGGRPRALTAKQVKEVNLLLSDPSVSVSDVAKRYGVGRTTLYAYRSNTT